MKIGGQLTDQAILGELGARIAATRLRQNMTQGDLAAAAGVAKRTLERMEAGEVAMQFSNFIRISRALGYLGHLDAVLPEDAPGPMELLQMRGKQRRRATGSRTVKVKEEPWKWGDEA